MSFKTILVSLNDVERVDEIAGLACQLASEHDAHLIGLFVIPMMPVYPVPGAYVLPELIESYDLAFAERAKTAKARFDELVRKFDLRSEWRQIRDTATVAANAVIHHGHQADLVVIGQVDPDNQEGTEADFADRVVMESGRPVLLVPFAGTFESVGDRVVVGWNATREAARATLEAIPMLETASQVWLTWVDPQRDPDHAGQLPGSEMATTLARHGITATTDAAPTADLEIGDALLNRVSDHSADLLVAGAYGHSQMREYVFGGATRTLMNNMTVPTLMSH